MGRPQAHIRMHSRLLEGASQPDAPHIRGIEGPPRDGGVTPLTARGRTPQEPGELLQGEIGPHAGHATALYSVLLGVARHPRPPPLLCRSRLWRRIWSTFTAMSETFWAMAWIRSMRPVPAESLRGRSQGEPAVMAFPGAGEGGLSLPAKDCRAPSTQRPACAEQQCSDRQSGQEMEPLLSQPGLMELTN